MKTVLPTNIRGFIAKTALACIGLSVIGLMVGTVTAIICATIVFGALLSFHRVALMHTIVWLLVINISLFAIGRTYDDLTWPDLIIVTIATPVLFFMSWGAGIRLSC